MPRQGFVVFMGDCARVCVCVWGGERKGPPAGEQGFEEQCRPAVAVPSRNGDAACVVPPLLMQ